MTERMVPAGFHGNYWGPAATEARKDGRLPKITLTPQMQRWDEWGRKNLRSGDIVFRLGDARVAKGWFPMSRFLANASNSKFSHTGVVSVEDGEPFVYDTTRTSVARQPFCVWILDNVGHFGVKRLKPEYRSQIPQVVDYVHDVFEKQVPFDYELGLDDKALYCIELTEKAFRHAGLKLSDPIRLGDMERAAEFPVQMIGIAQASQFALKSPLTFEQEVFFPGNERHGIWSSDKLQVVVPPTFTPGYPFMADHGLPQDVASAN
ncbi:YiiX/YebB-like N1pC/P60 family cysteine hydrolase [Paludisphaera rhizosphaerae]|uniref:YiiX/YebB-like N1pC/P60 family cysteine hydrolase n=1 Tax=Paludisphaera rhizosphaerae TaxID=2711216 RepID=UPI0013EAE4A5|nr:YiiX/YebB-like N1pC/P60 family cysteine hydrolase [Paludisphaera rhizosphaerae]